MLLSTKPHTAGNRTRYALDYSNWLDEGESLSSGVVVIDPAHSVSDITLVAATVLNSTHLLFIMSGGSVNEAFILDVQITNSRGEVKNDTIGFFIVAP